MNSGPAGSAEKLDADGQEELRSFIARIAALPPLEQEERLLGYFVESFVGLSTEDLRCIRALFGAGSNHTAAKETMLEVLDGQLALRAMGVG